MWFKPALEKRRIQIGSSQIKCGSGKYSELKAYVLYPLKGNNKACKMKTHTQRKIRLLVFQWNGKMFQVQLNKNVPDQTRNKKPIKNMTVLIQPWNPPITVH